MATYQLTQEDKASDTEKAVIRQGLHAYNVKQFGYDDVRPLNFFLRDESGSIVGGLLGYTYWDFLAIDILWLDETVRGQGFGQTLLARAEQAAVRRGCTTAHLDTFEFQAPLFYEKYGYELWGVLDGYAGRFKRLYYKKDLTA